MSNVRDVIVSWREARARARTERYKKRHAAHRAKLQRAWKEKVGAAKNDSHDTAA